MAKIIKAYQFLNTLTCVGLEVSSPGIKSITQKFYKIFLKFDLHLIIVYLEILNTIFKNIQEEENCSYFAKIFTKTDRQIIDKVILTTKHLCN